MIYDLSNPLHREQFKTRCNALYTKGAIVTMTEKRFARTLSQNRYLHLILGYFAYQYGEDLKWVKEKYFKILCNSDIFVKPKNDPFIGETTIIRSTADLDTSEMSLAIDRFRDWSAKEAEIYLPSPDEEELLKLVEMENERNQRYI